MGRQNIAYLISDNWRRGAQHQPHDSYLQAAKATLETYFAPPFGSYRIAYVNTFQQVVNDLARRFRASDDKVGNLIVVLHGAVDRVAARRERYRINLPISGRIQVPLTLQQFQDEVDNLGDILNERARTRKDLTNLRRKWIDDRSTLTFMGCAFGHEQGILDTVRDFLGGNLTVFAPKEFQGFRVVPLPRGINEATVDQLVESLAGMGLLQVPRTSPLARVLGRITINAALLRRLSEVHFVPHGKFEYRSLLEENSIPILYILPSNAQADNHVSRIYPQRQDVVTHWGVSSPRGLSATPIQLQNRLRQVYPGALPPLLVTPTMEWEARSKELTHTLAPRPRARIVARVSGRQGGPLVVQTSVTGAAHASFAERQHQEQTQRLADELARRQAQDLAQQRARRAAEHLERDSALRRVAQEREQRAREAAQRRATQERERQAREATRQRRDYEEFQRRQLAIDRARNTPPQRSTIRPEFWPRPRRVPLPIRYTIEAGGPQAVRGRLTGPDTGPSIVSGTVHRRR